MATELTGVDIAGDAIKYFVSEAFCMESLVIRNNTGADRSNFNLAGMPVVIDLGNGRADLILATGENTATGIIAAKDEIESLADAASTTKKYPVLVRGPAILLEDGFPDNDPAGTAYTKATLHTRFETLDSIVVRTKSSVLSQTQTS